LIWLSYNARSFWRQTVTGVTQTLLQEDITNENRLTNANLVRCIPYWGVYLSCFPIFVLGWTYTALLVALFSYLIKILVVTGFYHRYFSHKTFKTNRFIPFIFAQVGASARQRGPRWSAAHSRYHHRAADKPSDPRFPVNHGFWWSHMSWVVSAKIFPTQFTKITDFSVFPELRFLDRYNLLLPALYGMTIFGIAVAIKAYFPWLETSAWQILVWGFFVSTMLYQTPFLVNLFAHRSGKRSYPIPDKRRNSWIVAIVTVGGGWPNNHHFYPGATRQGFTWKQFDPTYWALPLMARFGIAHDLTPELKRTVQLGRGR